MAHHCQACRRRILRPTSAGNYLHFVDLATMKQSYLPSVGGRGIGAIAVHPSKQYICVAEVGAEGAPPAAYLYEYPSLRLYRVLRHGTERAYTAVCFNVAGDKVASVGAFPDFMLTVWNWKQARQPAQSASLARARARLLRLGPPGGSGRRTTPMGGRQGPLGAPPPPRVLQRAASSLAGFDALRSSSHCAARLSPRR